MQVTLDDITAEVWSSCINNPTLPFKWPVSYTSFVYLSLSSLFLSGCISVAFLKDSNGESM